MRTDRNEDRAIIAAAAAGDESSFAALLERVHCRLR
jgi:hypothetical protein